MRRRLLRMGSGLLAGPQHIRSCVSDAPGMGAQTSFDGFDPASGGISRPCLWFGALHRMGGGSMRSWRRAALVLIGVLSVASLQRAAAMMTTAVRRAGPAGPRRAVARCPNATRTSRSGWRSDIGRLSDKSFNDAANARAAAGDRGRRSCARTTPSSSPKPTPTGSDRDQNVQALAERRLSTSSIGRRVSRSRPGVNTIARDFPDAELRDRRRATRPAVTACGLTNDAATERRST